MYPSLPYRAQLDLTGRRGWLEERRQQFERRIVHGVFVSFRTFQDLYSTCRAEGRDGASWYPRLKAAEGAPLRELIWTRLAAMIGDIDRRGPLWQLKDTSHLLWPRPGPGLLGSGVLLDWVIGSVFHEMVKLKENIYLLRSYGLAGTVADSTVAGGVSDPTALLLIHAPYVENLPERVLREVEVGMERVGRLFCRAAVLVRTMAREFAANPLVIRLLVEQEDAVADIWGETLETVFAEIYDGQPEEGFCQAGRSYMQAQWYLQALAMYERALHICPDCSEAVVRVPYLRVVAEENRPLLESAP